MRRSLSFVCVLGAVLAGTVWANGAAPTAVAAAPTSVTLDGRGWGHGIGMSQWGAYGYAVDHGWAYTQILDHYYGGTVMGTTDVSTVAVRMLLHDDRQTAVVNDLGTLVVDGVDGGPWRSVVARETAPSSYTVWARADQMVCPAEGSALTDAGGWTVVATGLGPSVTVRTVTDTSASTDYRELPALCEPDGKVRSYRGFFRAVNGTAGENRTVNVVPLEQYLRSVIAKEMSPSWASAGGGKGAHALRAQAVAARSYALAENRYSYARTCDLSYCQVYLGAALRSSVAGAFSAVEHPLTDAAVAATAGQVRRVGNASGPVAYTMFAASSGGHTAPSSLPFPPVPDLGDATPGNPNHTWTVTIPASTIVARYPVIGTFTALTVLTRDGYGEWGGRVLTVRVSGTNGSVTVTGDQLKSALGLKMNWFAVRSTGEVPAEPPPPTDPPPAGAAAPAVCGTRVPPLVVGAPDTPPARFVPVTPRRLADTRLHGAGGVLPAGCTLVVDPGVAGAVAAAVNVTTADSQRSGFVTVYPCGVARPHASGVQAIVGRIVASSSIVPLGAEGTICVYSDVTTNIIVDLFGWFGRDMGHRFEPMVAVRRFDSRSSAVLPARSVTRVAVVAPGAAPAGATAAVLTVHAANPVVDGYVTVYPCSAERPYVSSVNAQRGVTVANQVIVALSGSGEVCVYVDTPMHVVVDLGGWFGPAGSTEFNAMNPARVVDTRIGQGLPGAVAAGSSRPFRISGVVGVPSDAKAVVATVTAVEPRLAGYITVHPCLPAVPNLSMVRYTTAGSAAAVVTSPTDSSGRWCVMPSTALEMVVDVSGWFR